MTSTSEPVWRKATIVNDLGLHARAAAKLAKTAQAAKNKVWLKFGSDRVDAKQVIDIMTLGAAKGDQVSVGIEQVEDLGIMKAIVELFASGFGE